MKKKEVYFSHNKMTYNSEVEKSALSYISRRWQESFFCPNRHGDGLKSEDFIKAVNSCAKMLVLEHDGFVGKGGFEEISHALKKKKPVFLIIPYSSRDGIYKLRPVTGIRVIDDLDWNRHARLEIK